MWSLTVIIRIAVVPAGASTGKISVINTDGAGAVSSKDFYVNIVTPNITAISPLIGSAGDEVVVSGTNFLNIMYSGGVYFNSKKAPVKLWSDTQIVVEVPLGATSGNVSVTNGNGQGDIFASVFTINPVPVITRLTKTNVAIGESLTFIGYNFLTTKGDIYFGSAKATNIDVWSNTYVTVDVPVGAQSDNIFLVNSAGYTSVFNYEHTFLDSDNFKLSGKLTAFWGDSGNINEISGDAYTGTSSIKADVPVSTWSKFVIISRIVYMMI